ncbi:MAG: putative glutamyl-tRNA synthetase-related protein [Burkholderiaceae bacterium]|nr:putative glutamyl-tRNA synthetase-related protein [Burkholderiaceae bacterium]
MYHDLERTYRGRFAPSPTGPLHFGSLVAAVGSYLEAQVHHGEWLVRIEDVDITRCRPAYEHAILRTLDCHGFRFDARVMRQSGRTATYQKALNRLFHDATVFGCACTRKEIGDSTLGADGAPVYPGTCRAGLPPDREARAWRIRVGEAVIAFDDGVQGRVEQNLATEAGDFVLLRADGLFAYQLAVVVDDAEQEITHVVRGADLLDSTPRQIFLQQGLGVPTPQYVHLPVAVNAAGEKLSKQTMAAPLDDEKPVPALWRALDFLGQSPPAALEQASLHEFWEWATIHWSLAKVPKTRTIAI